MTEQQDTPPVADATTLDPQTAGPAPDAAAVGELVAAWVYDALWADGPYEGSGATAARFALVYEEGWTREDHAAPPGTAIFQTADGRHWHATIAVTAVEQTVRTAVEDDEDGTE
jgi:hypothetical protein